MLLAIDLRESWVVAGMVANGFGGDEPPARSIRRLTLSADDNLRAGSEDRMQNIFAIWKLALAFTTCRQV